MAFSITKSYTPSSGQVSDASAYNTDMAALFNTLNGLQSQTTTIGGLTIVPSANSTSVFDVQNAAATSVFAVDTTNAQIMTGSGNGLKWKVFSGTLDSDNATNIAHGLTDSKILGLMVTISSSASYYVTAGSFGGTVVAADVFLAYFSSTNIVIEQVGTNLRGRAYRAVVFYVA